MDIKRLVKKILEIDKKKKIKYLILFGSVAEKKSSYLSDVDIAVYYDGSKKERFNFRIKVLGSLPDKVDLQIFQDLPLSVQNEVIKGKLQYCNDHQLLVDQSMKVIRSFSFFEKYFNTYLEAVA